TGPILAVPRRVGRLPSLLPGLLLFLGYPLVRRQRPQPIRWGASSRSLAGSRRLFARNQSAQRGPHFPRFRLPFPARSLELQSPWGVCRPALPRPLVHQSRELLASQPATTFHTRGRCPPP